ncbi:MAG: DUF6265 family protein [Gemmatimonadales bacterium]|nr:DUF6265 family protein [Gemmatimonadales bacterium]
MRLLTLSVLLLTLPTTLVAQNAAPADSVRPKTKPAYKLEKLDWMAGCWMAETGKDERVEENWTQPSDNLMLATTRYLTKGVATGWEFTRIAATDSGIVFAAASNGKPESVYTLVRQANEYVFFERKGTEFPQRIIYRRSSDGALIPRNEGDGQQSIELRLLRVRCPGDKK